MKNLIFLFLLASLTGSAQTEPMSNKILNKLFHQLTEDIEGTDGAWQFSVDSTLFLCLTDENNNRMRIISPITEISKVSKEEMLKCMEANFHTALDVKYAVSEDILWSVFIHPLKELTKEQVISALAQVYSAANTYGSTYSSGLLSFPKAGEEVPAKDKKM